MLLSIFVCVWARSWNLFHKDLRFARETERISAALTKASDQLQDFRLLEFLF